MALPPTITPYPPYPARGTAGDDYVQKADAFHSQHELRQQEENALAAWMVANAADSGLPPFGAPEIGTILKVTGGGLAWGYSPPLLAVIQDEKPSNVHGGASVVGWQTRTLNTEAFDPDGLVSLTGNEFTPSRDCGITWSVPSCDVSGGKTRVVRMSDSAAIAYGGGSYLSAQQGFVALLGAARIVGGETYRLEQYASNAATYGRGRAINDGSPEIYTQITFWG